MKAIQASEVGKVAIKEINKSTIKDEKDVLVKIMAAGICGSDVHIVNGSNPYATYPIVLGHEMSGIVEEIGNSVTNVKVGDKVVVEPIDYCGSCYACKKGRPNVCEKLQVTGVHKNGGFADYIVKTEKCIHKIPDNITFEQAAMVEPYTIGYQSVWRGNVRKGDVVLVIGGGAIGQIVLDVAKSIGAITILSEINTNRLELAQKIGVDYTINPSKEDLYETVMKITNNMGANVIFEAAGASNLLPTILDLVSSSGNIVSMSFDKNPIGIDFSIVNKKELTISGTRLQSLKFEQTIDNLTKHIKTIDMLITDILPFEEFEKGFKLFQDKNSKTCKVILKNY